MKKKGSDSKYNVLEQLSKVETSLKNVQVVEYLCGSIPVVSWLKRLKVS